MAARNAYPSAPLILLGGAAAALLTAAVVQSQPLAAFAAPAILITGLVAQRHPDSPLASLPRAPLYAVPLA